MSFNFASFLIRGFLPLTLRAACGHPVRLSCRMVIRGFLPLTLRAACGHPVRPVAIPFGSPAEW